MPKSLFHKTSRGESLRRGTALLTLPDPFPRSQAQNELLTTEAGLQVLDIAVLCSGVFLPEKNVSKIFSNISFFLPVYSMSREQPHLLSVSSETPGQREASQQRLTDPAGFSLHWASRKATSGDEERDRL